MNGYALDWLGFIVRWAHVIAGISWIGASFYFVWLDDQLERPPDDETQRGASGHLWAVHGGGFYHNLKYPTGPRGEPLARDLHWFYWEAYSTWLSGLAMLAIVYWADAGAVLVDRNVLALSAGAAIAISAATLVAGWFVYDALCRLFADRPAVLWSAVIVAVVAATYGLFHLFSARAATLHVGAILGTIMVANVFFVIIPGQRRVVAALRRGETPDPRPGARGKMRSVHNTYFTLPVLFAMIGAHYPFAYAGPYGWLVLLALCAAGVLVRRFFVLTHKRRFVFALPISAAVIVGVAAFAVAPRPQRGASAVSYAQAGPIVARRCAVCHAATPTEPGFTAPPMGVLLDTPQHVAANARRIEEQAVNSHAMPLGNVTHMTDAERATLGAWIAAGAPLR
ncbi:MAG TPA: urate hydroxylase PuuD [Candidatus Baltobacteraceae bacterium]|nr:urate hydroxylase PuuD [Candidatus Baltobacteraceae bacterium]